MTNEEDEREPIIRNPPAPGDVQVGDYVFASRWGDCDPGDPWAIGTVAEVGECYVVLSHMPRRWPKAMRITHYQSQRIIAFFPGMEHKPLDYEAIARVFQGP